MMEETRIFKTLDDSIAEGRHVVLVTVVSCAGSTPRDSGARMLVFGGGKTEGTVGGGTLEAVCIKEALALMKSGEKTRKCVFDLTAKGLGMECAGRAEVFFESFARDFSLLLLGAGHVGRKIAEMAACAGLPYSVADDRAEFANRERFPHACEIIVKPAHKALGNGRVDGKTYVVIATRGHSLDQECLEAALGTKAAYIGMIGSKSKIPAVFRRLNAKGLHPQKDKRVYSPIGLDVGGKTPGEIAVSVIAEVLKLANGRGGGHMGGKKA